MAELLKEQEERYFNRRITNQQNYRQSVARTVGTDTVVHNPEHTQQNEGNQNVTRYKTRLLLVDKLWLTTCAIISVCILMVTLTIRLEIVEINRSIDQLEDSITEYQTQTEQLKGQIIEQYNYASIKEAAQSNGMTIDKNRVRTVGE